jgi:hypothetical protein
LFVQKAWKCKGPFMCLHERRYMVEFPVYALKPHGNVNYLFFLVLVLHPLDQFEISIHDTMMLYLCNSL